MARIEVIAKHTGQKGSIPEENFNPQLFDRVESTTQETQGSSGGFAGIIKSAFVDPVVNYAKFVGEAGAQGARAIAHPEILKSALGMKLTPEEISSLSKQKISFILPEEKLKDRKEILKTGAKATAGAAALVLPAGGTLKTALGLGAVAGGLGAYGRGGDILSGVIGGGLTGGTIKGLGNVAGFTKSLLGKGVKAIGRKSAANLLKSTGSDVVKSIERHGINPTKLVTKYVPAKSSYDDLLGNVAQRGNGGIIKSELNAAEQNIQKVIKSTRGSNIRVGGDDIIKGLENELKVVQKELGGGTRAKALENVIKQAKAKYKRGLTVKGAFDIVRRANKKFGASVVDTTPKEAIVSASQKVEAQTFRKILKGMFPELKNSLKIQEELFILKPMLNKARGASAAKGLGLGGFDITRPGTILDPLLKQPQVSSTLAQAQNIKNPLSNILQNKASGDTTQILSRLLGGATVSQPTTTPQPAPQTQVEPQVPTGQQGGIPQITNDILLKGRLQLSDSNYKKLVAMKELQDSQGGQSNVGKVAAKDFSNAKSGLSSLDEIKSLIFNNDGTLDKIAIIAMKTPGRPNTKSRKLGAQFYNMADVLLRLRTGAQANPTEIKKLADNLEPGITDSAEVINDKLSTYENVFKEITRLGGK